MSRLTRFDTSKPILVSLYEASIGNKGFLSDSDFDLAIEEYHEDEISVMNDMDLSCTFRFQRSDRGWYVSILDED
jgi:hypothetical protein